MWCKNWQTSCSKEAVERWRRLEEGEERQSTGASSVLFPLYTARSGVALLSSGLPPAVPCSCCPRPFRRIEQLQSGEEKTF